MLFGKTGKSYLPTVYNIRSNIKVKPREDFSKDRKDIPAVVSTFKRGAKLFLQQEASRKLGVQPRGLKTSKTWNVLSDIKRDIMRISVQKSKAKNTTGAFKIEKSMKMDQRVNLKRNPCDRSGEIFRH